MLFAFLDKVWKIKIVAVKVDQVGVRGSKREEIFKKSRLVLAILGKPLSDMPAVILIKSGANQVQGRTFCSESGRFNVKKQDFVNRCDPLYRVFYRKLVD